MSPEQATLRLEAERMRERVSEHDRLGRARTIISTPQCNQYWFDFGTQEWEVPLSPEDYRVHQDGREWRVIFVAMGVEIYRGPGPVRIYSAKVNPKVNK